MASYNLGTLMSPEIRTVNTPHGIFRILVYYTDQPFVYGDSFTGSLGCVIPIRHSLITTSITSSTPYSPNYTGYYTDGQNLPFCDGVYLRVFDNGTGYNSGIAISTDTGVYTGWVQRNAIGSNTAIGLSLIHSTTSNNSSLVLSPLYETDSSNVEQAATSERWGTALSNENQVFVSGGLSANDSISPANLIYQASELLDTDPYSDIGTSDTGGGGGTGTAGVTSDDINVPSLPTYDATDTGFITLYRPSTTELKNLASYMWSSAFDIDTFKKLFADPMEAILGLSKLGVNAPSGSAQTVTVGNFSTGVSMTTLSEQYFEIDCGTLNVEEIKESYLSFSPYTKVSIYLPFIGVQQLNVDDFMSGSVSLIYKFDALSGSCLALITCAKSNKGVASLNSVLYSFMGQCSATIPVNGNDFANMISSAVTIGASIAGIAATGGAAAPLAVPTMASAAVNALKPTIQHSGSISGAGAILGVKTPYLIFERPRYCIPSNQNKYIGYPSFIAENVGDLSGYTVFEDIKITGNSHATMGEIEEIENIMKEGVYL